MTITARLFGIRYVPVRTRRRGTRRSSRTTCSRGEEQLGRIHLDLHPRPDKYKHAAQFPLVTGVQDVQLPEGVLVCNFADPAVRSPALLDHDDVVTLFHEFGHLMHHVLGGRQRWLGFSGVRDRVGLRRGPVARCSRSGRGTRTRCSSSPGTSRPASRSRRSWSSGCARPTSSARARTRGIRSSTRSCRSRSTAGRRRTSTSRGRWWSCRSSTRPFPLRGGHALLRELRPPRRVLGDVLHVSCGRW